MGATLAQPFPPEPARPQKAPVGGDLGPATCAGWGGPAPRQRPRQGEHAASPRSSVLPSLGLPRGRFDVEVALHLLGSAVVYL